MKKIFKLSLIVFALFIFVNAVQAQTTYYVSTSGNDANDGSSWATAFRNLTTALAAGRNSSSASVIINVASGTYKPSEGVPNSNDRDATFKFYRADFPASNSGKSLKIYGGFDASTGIRTAKNNNTILSGDIGVEGDNTDNAYHVAVVAGIGSVADSVVVDGFTIRDGNANGDGLYIVNQNLGIIRYAGGGVSVTGNDNDKIAFRNCIFSSNAANITGGLGGGLSFDDSGILLDACIFENNSAGDFGGGAIRGEGSGQGTIINSIFLNNSGEQGSALFINGVAMSITNSTFTGNSGGSGCISVSSVTTISLANNIIYGNSTAFNSSHGTINAAYNIIQGGFEGTGNINANPSFTNAADADGPDNIWGTADDGLRPTVCSPAVNSGSNDADKVLSVTDITGAARIQNGVVDIGAYELSETPAPATYYRDADGDFHGDPNNPITGTECSVPSGYVRSNDDCDDAHSTAFPGAPEICDGIDNNCDGQVDEGCSGTCQNASSLSTTNITLTGARLNWTAATNPAAWEVQYKSTAKGSKWTSLTLAGFIRSTNILRLMANQVYNWHIRAKCGKKWTKYSNVVSFTTGSGLIAGSTTAQSVTTKNKAEEKLSAVKLYPNPTKGQFIIELHLANNINTNAKIELVNMMGQTVSADNASINNGTLYKNVSISSSLSSGIYTARIIVSNKTYTTKLIYQK
jgi:hypothetical protein